MVETTQEAPPPPATRSGNKYRAALRHRDLRTLVIAFVVDGGASWSYNIVLIAYVFSRTHSAGWVTALVTVNWVVGMLFGGYGGVLADRYDRRAVLLVSAVVAAAITVGVAVVVAVNAPIWLLLVTRGALSASCTPIRPASGALIPEVVPESELIAANAIFALLESIIVVVGPGIGGLLLLTGKPVYGVLINTASYVVAAGLYLMLNVRSRGSAEPGGNVFAQWFAGVASLKKHRKAFVLTVFLVLDSAAVNAANVLMPALAKHLHGGGTGYSLLIAANAFGGVVVAGVANKLALSRRVTLIITAAIYLECVPLWVSFFAGSIGGALGLQLMSGIGMVIVDVLAFTALQRDLPREVLGRVLGTVDVLILGSAVLTSVLGSALYEQLGLSWALGVIGLALPTVGLLGLPMLRGLDAEVAGKLAALEPVTSLLDGLDLFAGAPRSLVEQLAGSAVPNTVAAGGVVIEQGTPSDALWILAEGTLAVRAVREDGASIELPDVVAPGYVGELGLMNRTVRSATVVAKTECRLLRIPGEEFITALEDAQPSPTMLGRAGVRLARTAPGEAAPKKAPRKRAARKKTAAKKAPARKAPAKKAPAKKAAAKKAPAKKTETSETSD
jgi:MFS family permease